MNFKKRVNGSWADIPHYIHKTATDTITTLPAVLYPTGTTATVGLKGQTVQSSTPSPTSPVMPEGAGDLETSGAKAGQYKTPISSAGQTTPVYLGEVESTRQIKKLVLTGDENFSNQYGAKLFSVLIQPLGKMNFFNSYCTHYKYNPVQSGLNVNTQNGDFALQLQSTQTLLAFKDMTYSSTDDFKSYLAAQYAAGTPVTVWYVLITPETAVVNEPLMRIGEYADEVSNISIPVTAGGDTISVDTTLQPSEVTATYKGWHPVQNVHERDNGAWT